jgi:ElaB/YqjD/DUF883 family membrane-anchored ribosome-binding protein
VSHAAQRLIPAADRGHGHCMNQATEQAQEAAGQAKNRLREQVDQRSTRAGETVSSAAQDARTVGEELRKQGKDQPARLADQAAERVERVGSYLQQSDADRILRDVEDFGRRQPWAIAAAGIALGFVASRFLRASSSERYRTSTSGGPSIGGPNTGGPNAGGPSATPGV